jgi:hypothetical protein
LFAREHARLGHLRALGAKPGREKGASIPASAPAAGRPPPLRFQQGCSWAQTSTTPPERQGLVCG